MLELKGDFHESLEVGGGAVRAEEGVGVGDELAHNGDEGQLGLLAALAAALASAIVATMELGTDSAVLVSAVMVICTGVILLYLRSLGRRLDRYEDQNQAEHTALTAQVKAQGKELKNVRIEVGKLSSFTGRELVEALRRLVGTKDPDGPQDPPYRRLGALDTTEIWRPRGAIAHAGTVSISRAVRRHGG